MAEFNCQCGKVLENSKDGDMLYVFDEQEILERPSVYRRAHQARHPDPVQRHGIPHLPERDRRGPHLSSGRPEIERELRSFCDAEMAEYMRPFLYEFRGSLPLTPAGKVDYKLLEIQTAGQR